MLVVLAVLACIVILAGVCVFAIQKMKPDWLRIHAGAGRAISFGIEIGRGGDSAPPPERGELESRRDK